MGLFFFPRGGSAYVARNLAKALPPAGWDVTLLSGSRDGDARAFYGDVIPVEAEPLSYEGHPDRAFACLDDEETERQTLIWCRALQAAGAADMDLLHLHHLTPLNEAAARVAPNVPVIGHLHGTELLMLEEIDRWPHGAAWAERMRRWAAACEWLIVPSRPQAERAQAVLDADRFLVLPNGYDPDLFHPRPGPRTDTLLYAGRFTKVKRVPLLIEAYARAREGFATPAPLVLAGGFPDEWEGEHPRDAIARVNVPDVHLLGWKRQEELAELYSAAAAVVLPSVRELFGQTLIEGMACGAPAVAVNVHGPADIVIHGETGWLVEPDDVVSLANALVEVVNRPHERRRRGKAAREDVARRFAWPALAERLADAYDATLLREAPASTV
jgi:glycosyltransferase involved in cell wall biosynthesis